MMNSKLIRKIAGILILVMLLGCFTGCKNDSEAGVGGVVDMNGVAGDEIEIDIPDAPVRDDDSNGGQTNTPSGNDQQDDQTETPSTDDQQDDQNETPSTDDQQNDQQNDQQDDQQGGENSDNEDLFGDEEIEKPAYDESKELVVVSYNIKCAMYGKTIDKVVEQINAVGADIVGFQEVDYMSNRSGNSVDQIASIAGKAGFDYFYFEPVIELGKNAEKYNGELKPNLYGHAVMSKYPITKSEIIWPDAQNAKGGEPRNFGRHEIDVDGTTVVLYNGHLDGTEGRNQYFEIQEKYMVDDEYAICLGDFNETYSEFGSYFDFEKYYSFAFRDGSNVVMRGKEGSKSQVIDHIIVTKDKFVWKNGGEEDNGYYVTEHDGASDHNMIYCYLNIIK